MFKKKIVVCTVNEDAMKNVNPLSSLAYREPWGRLKIFQDHMNGDVVTALLTLYKSKMKSI